MILPCVGDGEAVRDRARHEYKGAGPGVPGGGTRGIPGTQAEMPRFFAALAAVRPMAKVAGLLSCPKSARNPQVRLEARGGQGPICGPPVAPPVW